MVFVATSSTSRLRDAGTLMRRAIYALFYDQFFVVKDILCDMIPLAKNELYGSISTRVVRHDTYFKITTSLYEYSSEKV